MGRLRRLGISAQQLSVVASVVNGYYRKGKRRRLAMASKLISGVGPVHVQQFRKSEEYRSSKIALLEALLMNWQSWRAILEDSGIETLVIGGEEWNFYDMLDGIKELPPRQKQALWLILIEDKRPVDVARTMFAGSKKIVGEMAVQYKDDALAKLIARHEQQKEGRL
jgi:hypothetical protein